MRSEFARKIRGHDWFYGYSDDHRYWTAGRKQAQVLRAMHSELDCPFSLGSLQKWAHKMILEHFAEENPGEWYRQPRHPHYRIAPSTREDLITQKEFDEITNWMSVGSEASEISSWM